MNILEMEDMVKGLPDQVLRQYAQFPDPQIPQFLALSEVQRRQDMRQRFQAQQQQAEPSVKDQILQSGIAAAAPPMAPSQGMPQQAPAMMASGGVTPGGIVRMQQGRTVPFSYESLTPAQLRKMADVLTSLGLYPSGGLDSISFNRLPLSKREGLFAALERAGVPSQTSNPEVSPSPPAENVESAPAENVESAPAISESVADSPPPNLGVFGRVQGTEDINILVQSLDPQGVRALFAEALNKGDLSSAERIRSAGVGSGKLDPRIADQIFNQITRLRGQEISDAETESFVQERSSQARQDVAQREAARAAEQARLAARANYLLTGQENAAVAAETSPTDQGIAAVNSAPADVAPDATVTEPSSGNSDQGIANLVPPPPPPSSDSNEIMKLARQMFEPREISESDKSLIDLINAQREAGIPAPIDLSEYEQKALARQKEAKESARNMAIASALMNLGTGLVAGDPAAGLKAATQSVSETLAKGRAEAAAEGRAAEQLRLQQAQNQRQAQIEKMKLDREALTAISGIYRDLDKSTRESQGRGLQIMATYDAALQTNISRATEQDQLNRRSFMSALSAAEEAIDEALANEIGMSQEDKAKIKRSLTENAIKRYAAIFPGLDVKAILKANEESAADGSRFIVETVKAN